MDSICLGPSLLVVHGLQQAMLLGAAVSYTACYIAFDERGKWGFLI